MRGSVKAGILGMNGAGPLEVPGLGLTFGFGLRGGLSNTTSDGGAYMLLSPVRAMGMDDLTGTMGDTNGDRVSWGMNGECVADSGRGANPEAPVPGTGKALNAGDASTIVGMAIGSCRADIGAGVVTGRPPPSPTLLLSRGVLEASEYRPANPPP